MDGRYVDGWYVDGDECKNFRSFIRVNSTIVKLKVTTPTTMFVCGRGWEDFDYVVHINANITMNKEQERSLKFVDKKLKLDVVDRVVTQTLNIDIKNVTYWKTVIWMPMYPPFQGWTN